MKLHWTKKYLGMAWSPDFDCFALFADIQDTVFGISGFKTIRGVPRFNSKRNVLKFIETSPFINQHWHETPHPQEGDAVLFGSVSERFHIGVWVTISGQNGVIHNQKGHGVIFTPQSAMVQSGVLTPTYLRSNNNV